MKDFNSILKKEKELKDYTLKNDIIKSFDITIYGHYGNTMNPLMYLSSGCINFNTISSKDIQSFFANTLNLLDLTKEDRQTLSEITDVPIRLVLSNTIEKTIIGFGHFMKDKFILFEDIKSN